MADAETIFGRIVRGEIPCDKVLEDEYVLAFRDLHPVAPHHVLVIPKQPIAALSDATPNDQALLGRLLAAAAEVAVLEGLAEDGYRVVINNGRAAGQEVPHLHLHVLGGRPLSWPPG